MIHSEPSWQYPSQWRNPIKPEIHKDLHILGPKIGRYLNWQYVIQIRYYILVLDNSTIVSLYLWVKKSLMCQDLSQLQQRKLDNENQLSSHPPIFHQVVCCILLENWICKLTRISNFICCLIQHYVHILWKVFFQQTIAWQKNIYDISITKVKTKSLFLEYNLQRKKFLWWVFH